ncbi:MAG: hypothetical protein HQM11_13675 [SAR324 cluster bacterium]|nr:hypothetical protein [SAR324 cluster bacterium]
METLNISDTRTKLSQIVNNKITVEITNAKESSVIIPKKNYKEMEKRLVELEAQAVLNRNESSTSLDEIEREVARRIHAH